MANNFLAALRADLAKALDRIGSYHTFTWPFMAISWVWLTFLSVGYDRNRFGTPLNGWFITAQISNFAVLVIGVLISKFWLTNKPRKSKPLQTLLAFGLLGLVRSFAMSVLVVQFELAPTGDWGLRQLASLITLPTGLVITAILSSAIYDRQKALSEVMAERQQLIDLQHQAEGLFEEKRDEVHQIIDESIRPSIAEINQALTSDEARSASVSAQTTGLISQLIDQRLRPLSDALHEPAALSILPSEGSRQRQPLVKLNTLVSVKDLFSPFFVYIIAAASTVSATIYYVGALSILVGFGSYLPFLVVAALAKQFIPDDWKLSFWQALPVTTFAHLLAAAPSAYLILKFGEMVPETQNQVGIALIAFASSALAIAVAKALESERASFEQNYRQANSEAASVLANLNQRIWLTRKNAAQTLHGSVQAALTAANIRLRQGNLTDADLVKVREDIARALEALTTDDSVDFDLEDSIEELIELWDGVCQIDVQISPANLARINKDPVAANCVNEFLKECVNNAIKHGDAKTIDVEIVIQADDRVLVEVRNEGSQEGGSSSGLGTRILSEITLDWQRIVTPEAVIVIGVIALAS